MNQKQLNKINNELAEWDGTDASLNMYFEDFDRLVIGFKGPKNIWDVRGFCFAGCIYICGPTKWSNCKLRCHFGILRDGGSGIEVRDENNEFLLECAGPVMAGEPTTNWATD